MQQILNSWQKGDPADYRVNFFLRIERCITQGIFHQDDYQIHGYKFEPKVKIMKSK